MPTKNPRLNITFSPETAAILADLAKEERSSVSNLAKELILEALERREDIALSTLAKLRDDGKPKKTIGHEDAWK